MLPIISQPNACSCHLCGEKLTAPISYMGKLYGWSCIKKVNPSAKKTKENWQPCNLVSIEIINDYTKKITVDYLGKNCIGFESSIKLASGKIRVDTSIVENNGIYFINTLNFKNAHSRYINSLPINNNF